MKENKGEQPEQERAKCEACEGTGEDQCFGLKCLRCDGTGIEPAQAKMKEKDWKEKFEYWLINNLQFTSKVHRIIDHVERYIIPAAQPSKVQEELKKENELLEAREVAWQNKHSFLMEEIRELKAWKEDVVKFAELCMVFGLTFDGLRQQWKDGTGQIVSRQIVYDFIKSKLNNL